MPRKQAMRSSATYRQIAYKLSDLARELEDRPDALANAIALECFDEANLAIARDIARWAGARKLGRTISDAHRATAIAWLEYRAAQRASLGGAKGKAWLARIRLARRAHEAGLTIAEQRTHERSEQADADRLGALMRSRTLQRDVIASFAARHGRTFEVARCAA